MSIHSSNITYFRETIGGEEKANKFQSTFMHEYFRISGIIHFLLTLKTRNKNIPIYHFSRKGQKTIMRNEGRV